VTEPETTPVQDAWTRAWEEYAAAEKVANARYKAAIAPARKQRDQELADLGREFRTKLSDLKGELSATARRIHSQISDTRTWHDAKARAIQKGYLGVRQPALLEKVRSVADLKKKADEARNAMWAEESASRGVDS
jgi:hypothetical protein